MNKICIKRFSRKLSFWGAAANILKVPVGQIFYLLMFQYTFAKILFSRLCSFKNEYRNLKLDSHRFVNFNLSPRRPIQRFYRMFIYFGKFLVNYVIYYIVVVMGFA